MRLILRLSWGRLLTHVVVDRIQFQLACWTENFSLFSGDFHQLVIWVYMKQSTGFIETQRISHSKADVILSLWKVTVEVTSCHLCQILLVRTKSLVLPTLTRGELREDLNTGKWESWRPPQILSTTTVSERVKMFKRHWSPWRYHRGTLLW